MKTFDELLDGLRRELDELLDGLRRERGLPAKVVTSSQFHDEGSGVRVKKARLKRLSAAHRLAENPEARAAAEAFRDAMRGGK